MQSNNGNNLILRVTVVGSLLFVAVLLTVYQRFNSQLALAQAADSALDIMTALVLAWSVHIAAQPQDEDHHYGHARAEPIGALIAAIIAGVLAVTVARSAIEALINGDSAVMEWPLVAVFAGKGIFKTAVAVFAGRLYRSTSSPAMQALQVDSRNDVALNVVAVVGFFVARYGWGQFDAWLALPTAVWIGYSGFQLARENIHLLMGGAPSPERQDELLELALTVDGVRGAHDLRAHYLGPHLQVHIHVQVDPEITIARAHDIGESVRERLEDEQDVGFVAVHVDVEGPE